MDGGGNPLSIPRLEDLCLWIRGSLFSSPRGPFSVCRYPRPSAPSERRRPLASARASGDQPRPDGVTGTGGTGVCANESDPVQARYPFRQDLEYAKLSAERRSGGPEGRGYAVQTRFGF